MIPSQKAPHRAINPVATLIPAAMNPAPVRYAQNKPPGIDAGTRLAMNRGTRKWVTPKTTDDTANR